MDKTTPAEKETVFIMVCSAPEAIQCFHQGKAALFAEGEKSKSTRTIDIVACNSKRHCPHLVKFSMEEIAR